VNVFGGEEGHKKTQELDRKKYDLCKKNGVKLIYVDDSYNINEVITKIKSIIANSE
jgi:TRAP-type C4-dicarboxylate transport system substrate-binding protein